MFEPTAFDGRPLVTRGDYYARVIEDSRSYDDPYDGLEGARLTTLEVRFPRFVLAEFNTHRVFSRNSASSRARPTLGIIEEVEKHPVIPEFGSNKPGMQAGEELTDTTVDLATAAWLAARDSAVTNAHALRYLNVHKQAVNRILEPFMWHTVVVTSAFWQNFFDQRCSPLAQPEIRTAAELMEEVLEASIPDIVYQGGLHLPYVTREERESFLLPRPLWQRVSAARCARVSYKTFDGSVDPTADLALYEKLMSADPKHWSPLEHVAKNARGGERGRRNFGPYWLQLREILEPAV